jgi:hypothetical protein
MSKYLTVVLTALAGVTFHLSTAAVAQSAETVPPVYSWMLPKTVLDVSIVYTYAECKVNGKTAHYRFNVVPTVTTRAVPDKIPGWRTVDTNDLISFWNDQNITIGTYAGTHILSSVAANPVSQIGTIIGNVLTGAVKIAALSFGVAAPAAATPEGHEADCPNADDPASAIKGYRTSIQKLESDLASGTNTDTPQNVMIKVQALQNLMADAQSELSLTIKATIDPGYVAPDKIQVDLDEPAPAPTSAPAPIAATGLIASLTPSAGQLQKLKWIKPSDIETLQTNLRVNIYLDFAHASPKLLPDGGVYPQTVVVSHDNAVSYREPAYIPVLVWRGDKNAKPGDDLQLKSAQLLPTQNVAFAQYGPEQMVPYKADVFKNNSWTISFADNGEITNASFASKSWGANVTSLFGSAASAANAIGSEQRTAAQANSSSNQAAALQSQADLIYEKRRLALCQADAASCPSK